MHLWGTGQVLVGIWMPNMESTAARAPITQQSHLSQMHAHTDTAVFSVINKKWKHEALVGWPLKSSASKSSAFGFLQILFLPSYFWFLLMLTTCCSVGGVSQQVDDGSLISKICLVVCTHKVFQCEGYEIKRQCFWHWPKTFTDCKLLSLWRSTQFTKRKCTCLECGHLLQLKHKNLNNPSI